MPTPEACWSQMSTLASTVTILLTTPTTVYAVAVMQLWHLNPAHEMPVPVDKAKGPY